MSDLSPAARRLLASAVEHDGPSPQRQRQLEHKIAQAVSASTVAWASNAAAAQVTAQTTGGLAPAGQGLVAKVVAGGQGAAGSALGSSVAPSVGTAIGGAKGGAAAAAAKTFGGAATWVVAASVTTAAVTTPLVLQHFDSEPTFGQALTEAKAPSVASHRVTGPAPAVEPKPDEASIGAAPMLVEGSDGARSAAPSSGEANLAPRSALVAPSSKPSPGTSQRQVGAELVLLGKAQAALRAGDASSALALLDEHARRFSSGQLSAERQAARVLALCSLGRVVEARSMARRFLSQYPRSPLTQRINSSCVDQENSDVFKTESSPPGNE